MRTSMRAGFACLILASLIAIPTLVQAQTASSGRVSGTVTDPTGAVIPGATVEISNASTGVSRTVETNAVGIFVIPDVPAGTYTVSVKSAGFRTTTMTGVKVDAAKSFNLDFQLELGQTTEVVEVESVGTIELQTTDATVGSVIGGEALLRLPTINRSVTGLLLRQPLVQPGEGVSEIFGGQVAGARSDQSTFLLDGGESTSNVEGTGGYNTGQDGVPQAMIPTPAESIEEFRVSTTNPNATFGRSMGGQMVMQTKRGTNDIHGSAYWYHQNDNLNANGWDNNFNGIEKQELKDNRFGFSAGGPIVSDRTFVYGHYEGRRFPRTASTTRSTPTQSMRDGILTFPDGTGADIQYNFNLANGPLTTACGATGDQACDPRNLGINSTMSAFFNIMPLPTSTSGDPNFKTFRAPFDDTLDTDFAVVRLDHQFGDNWNWFSSYRYFSSDDPHNGQIDISGLTCASGVQVCSAGGNPLEPRYVVTGLNGQITPNFTSETRYSYARHWWFWTRTAPFSPVAGSDVAILASRIAEPINFDAQQARNRLWNGKDNFVSQNFNYITGGHTVQFGANYRNQSIIHGRSDKVTGGLTSGPTMFLDDSSFISTPSSLRPPTCSATLTTNCILSSDIGLWNDLVAVTLGMVDNMTRVVVSDSNFVPQPNLLLNIVDVTIEAVEVYAQDIWRVTPALTLTAGLTWQVQVPPEEATSRQSIPVFADTLTPVRVNQYFANRAAAARAGDVFNPTLAFMPVTAVAGLKRPMDIDWDNIGPRVSFAWNPSFDNPIFGDRKTVIRGGWSLTFTRMNGVGMVMTPALGPGVSQVAACNGPDRSGTCTSVAQTAATAFRVGEDGSTLNLPPLPSGFPLIPSDGNNGPIWGETRGFMIDPGMRLGKAHSFNLTWQRELGNDYILEVGYVRRVGENLQQAIDINSMPGFQLDPASGQTYGEAFDALALELRAGVAIAAVTPQPFFENQFINVDPATYLSSTEALADFFSGDITTGFMGDVAIFADAFGFRPAGQEFMNTQVLIDNWTTDGGRSNYDAAFFSLRRRFSGGMTFDLNYTWSHALDQAGLSQQWISGVTDPWDFDADYATSFGDRTHVWNLHGFWDLPFGSGRRFSTDSGALDRVVSGWYVSGIFTGSSALPLCVGTGGGNFGGFLGATCSVPNGVVNPGSNSVHSGIVGSGGVGIDSDPSSGGTGLNLFGDPEAVFNSFRRPLYTQDRRAQTRGHIRGLPRWNADLSFGKKTSITETVNFVLQIDLLNALNHVDMDNPTVSLNSARSFGDIASQFRGPRTIQIGLRFEF